MLITIPHVLAKCVTAFVASKDIQLVIQDGRWKVTTCCGRPAAYWVCLVFISLAHTVTACWHKLFLCFGSLEHTRSPLLCRGIPLHDDDIVRVELAVVRHRCALAVSHDRDNGLVVVTVRR